MNYAIDIPRWINVRELAEEIGVSHMAIYRARRGENVSDVMMERIKAAIEAKKEEETRQPAPAA